jgi:hypothetical protein
MRWAAVLGGVLALGISAGSVASALPIPPITVPTVTIPLPPAPPPTQVPVHVPPQVSPSPVPAPLSLPLPPAAPSAPPSVPSAPSAASGGVVSTASSPRPSSRSSPSSPVSQPSQSESVSEGQSTGDGSSRQWLSQTGSKSQQTTTFTFRLARKARVIFTVFEVSPACRLAARFAISGHAGRNRVRFNGRVHGRALPAGTYRIRARTIGGASLLNVLLVIADKPLSPAQLARARATNVCASARALATQESGELLAAPANGGNGSRSSEIARNQNAGPASSGERRSAAAPFSPARISHNATNPVVIAAFALATLLLGLAALPQTALPDPRLTYLLARHRLEIALAGSAALAAGLLALALA